MQETWIAAPVGEVLTPRGCAAQDQNGDPCALGRSHGRRHQGTGLRAWLEAGQGDALIRSYEAEFADRLEALERPVFAAHGFAPIARQDLALKRNGGLSVPGVLFMGVLAPRERVSVRLRIVCFART